MNKPRASTERVQLFENQQMERLTLLSPQGFFLVWGIVLPLIAWAGFGAVSAMMGAALFALGLIVWSLFEYAMHRFLFHWSSDAAPIKWLVFTIHGNHHDAPNDPLRNLMPPIVSLPLGSAIWALCYTLMGGAGTWLFFGFIVGYVGYDIVHYACHQWPMRSRLARAIKHHHMRHHHIAEDGNYAITAIFWDDVLGTRVRAAKRAR